MEECPKNADIINLEVTQAKGTCSTGESVGRKCIENESIPVLSCEGACIRGEIARLAANYLSKSRNYRRGCHGELFTVPDSKIAQWIKEAPKVICIDGCFLKCHSRIIENLIPSDNLLVFDALSHHKKYDDIFDIDDVPENERKEVARSVAEWVLKAAEEKSGNSSENYYCSQL
jgi:uncharacterized metal-binding protein